MHSSSPLRTPKSQLLNNHQQEDVGTHQKKKKTKKTKTMSKGKGEATTRW